MRKNYFVLLFALLNVCCLSAQSNKMIGKWKYDYEIFHDTTQAGRDEINQDYQAYMSGKKNLSKEFIVHNDHFVREENTTYEIKLVKKQYWMTDLNTMKKWKLVYNTKSKKFITPVIEYGIRYVISFDEKSGNTLFFDRFFKMSDLEVGDLDKTARSFYKKL